MNVEYNSDRSKVTVSGNCVITGNPHTVTVEAEGYQKWKSGALIQNALPDASADDREFLISGISPEGWGTLFPPEPTCCNCDGPLDTEGEKEDGECEECYNNWNGEE